MSNIHAKRLGKERIEHARKVRHRMIEIMSENEKLREQLGLPERLEFTHAVSFTSIQDWYEAPKEKKEYQETQKQIKTLQRKK